MSMSSPAKADTTFFFVFFFFLAADKASKTSFQSSDEASRLDWRRVIDVGFDIKGFPVGGWRRAG